VPTALIAQQAWPGHDVVFARGTPVGSTPVPGCPGTTVPLTQVRVIGVATATSNGEATLFVSPPSGASGRTAHLVAVDRDSCRTSTVYQASVP
jgi:hypothetical protein